MKFIEYIEKGFKPKSMILIDIVNSIICEYQRDGYSLTLRQLYYQLVARDVIENSQRSYKNVGKLINNGRLAGLIDWEAIVDRTRNLKTIPSWSCPESIINSAAASFRHDLWRTQPERVEVWVEKEALIGVIGRTCEALDVPYFACKGYVSQSEQWAAGRRILDRYSRTGQRTVILHLGDHDPSGIDMTRDNLERLCMFSENRSSVERIALNMEQVEAYDPPPNPAKMADSRYAQYIEEYGYSSWELDALEPKILDRLIRDHVSRHRDEDLMRLALGEQEEAQKQLRDIAHRFDDIVEFLHENDYE